MKESDGVYSLGEKVDTDITDVTYILDSAKYNTTTYKNAESEIIGLIFEETE
jgi:hypothetical protein